MYEADVEANLFNSHISVDEGDKYIADECNEARILSMSVLELRDVIRKLVKIV